MKIVKRLLFYTLLMITLSLIAIIGHVYFYQTITFFDQPSELSETEIIIEVTYINWACDCANFIESKHYVNNPTYEAQAEDCIFIEPASAELMIPEEFYDKLHFRKKLKLVGKFYANKGIPYSYQQKTPEKPEKAMVFKYVKIGYIDK